MVTSCLALKRVELGTKYGFRKDRISEFIILFMILAVAYPLIVLLQYFLVGEVYLRFIYVRFLVTLLVCWWLIRLVSEENLVLTPVCRYHILYVGYCLISTFLLLRFDYPISYVVFSFAATVFWFTALLPLSIVRPSRRLLWYQSKNQFYKYLKTVIALLFTIAFALGLAQHVLNDPLVPTELITAEEGSSVQHFKAMSINFFGQVRAFAFFDQPTGLGLLGTLFAVLAFSSLLFRRFSLLNVFLVAMGGYCVYITYLRMTYITFLFAMCTVTLIYLYYRVYPASKLLYRLVRWLPFIYLLFVGLVLVHGFQEFSKVGYLSIPVQSQGQLLDSSSTVMRFMAWQENIDKYVINGEILNVLFGYGLIQNDRFVELTGNILIDNSYIALIIYQGIVGMLLFLFLFKKLWSVLVKECLAQPNDFEVAVAGYTSSFLASALFANLVFWHNIFFFLLPFVVIRLNSEVRLSAKD